MAQSVTKSTASQTGHALVGTSSRIAWVDRSEQSAKKSGTLPHQEATVAHTFAAKEHRKRAWSGCWTSLEHKGHSSDGMGTPRIASCRRVGKRARCARHTKMFTLISSKGHHVVGWSEGVFQKLASEEDNWQTSNFPLVEPIQRQESSLSDKGIESCRREIKPSISIDYLPRGGWRQS